MSSNQYVNDRIRALGNFNKKPWITIQKANRICSYVSLDTYNTDFDISEAGVGVLSKYLDTLHPFMKKGSFYRSGRICTDVTVQNKIADEVAQTFLDVFNKYKKELPTFDAMCDAAEATA